MCTAARALHCLWRLCLSILLIVLWNGCSTAHCGKSASSKKASAVPFCVRRDLSALDVVVVKPTNALLASLVPIILLHEITGVSPECLDFAGRLSTNGFVVYIPRFFGGVNQPGVAREKWNFVRVSFIDCRWRFFWGGITSTPYRKISPLIERVHAQHPDRKVGVIGMCLSGSWPVALMQNTNVQIGAVCQPAVPWPAYPGYRRRNLGLSHKDLAPGLARIRKDRLTVLGFRFEKDPKSTDERLRYIAGKIQPEGRFVDGTIRKCAYPGDLPDKAHSVFTGYYLNQDDKSYAVTSNAFHTLVHEFREALLR